MMRGIISLALAALTTASILKPRNVDPRSLICLYMSVDADWQGEAFNLCQIPGKCAPKLPDGLSGQVSSAGGDQGANCWLYSEIDCSGDQSWPVSYPGFSNLEDIGFNDRAMSWKCEYA